jgi:hypothetical protein
MVIQNKKDQKRIPKVINVNDLKVTYSELFDDSYVPVPWDLSSYVTKIGDILIGFGEETYLRNALEKVKERYGENIKTVFIESKKIPKLSEPIIRRHGQIEFTKGSDYAGHWIIYHDDLLPTKEPVLLTETDPSVSHRDLVIKHLGRFLLNARYVKGIFGIDRDTGEGVIIVTGQEGLKIDPFVDQLVDQFPGKSKATLIYRKDPLVIYKVSGKKIRVKVILPLTEREKIYIEQFLPEEFDWGDITGDEYTNKNRNEPELWRPIHQVTKSI